MVWLHFYSLFALSKVWSTLVFVPYIKDIRILQTQKETSVFTRQKAVETLQHVASPALLHMENRIYHSCASVLPHMLGTVLLWGDSRAAWLWLTTQHSHLVRLHLGSLHPCVSGDSKSYWYCYRVKRTPAKA